MRFLAPIRVAQIAVLATAFTAGGAARSTAPESPRIAALKQQLARGDTASVRIFWNEMRSRGTPLVESIAGDTGDVLLTFLYQARGPIQGVAVVSQLHFNRGSAELALQNLPGTDVWFVTSRVRDDLRFSYGFVVTTAGSDTKAVHQDSLNPHVLPDGVGLMGLSLAEMPSAAPQPWVVPSRDVPARPLQQLDVDSRILKTRRPAWIYLPPGYDPRRERPYPVLVCFDGSWFATANAIPTSLDNLITQRELPPLIGVFVGQAPQPQRNIELDNNEPFADFVATELLPAVRSKWRVTADPRQTVVCGSSAGGVGAAFAAFRRPDVFGNVLSESGAFWPGHTREDREWEWLTRQIATAPKLPVRFVLHVGVLESGAAIGVAPSILETNRRLRDVLRSRGNEVHYAELAGGHEPVSWRGGVARGLIDLFGRGSSAAVDGTVAVPPEHTKAGVPIAAAAVPTLVAALRAHPVVAIGELHGARQAGDFYIQLARDTSFQNAVNDIVVEFASGQSQHLLDRYIVEGDSLPADTLESIWRNTTKVASWESPIYARWLASIREVNRELPKARRIRVLAGDTPVDWSRMRTPNDWSRLGDNNLTFAKVICEDVIAKGHHALVVLGNNHLARGGTFRDRSPNVTTLIERRFPGSLYIAMIYYGGFGDAESDARIEAEGWTPPAVVSASSWIGDRPVATTGGNMPLRTFADAVLYVGPRTEIVDDGPPPGYFDAAYVNELVRRSWIEWRDSTRLRRILTRP